MRPKRSRSSRESRRGIFEIVRADLAVRPERRRERERLVAGYVAAQPALAPIEVGDHALVPVRERLAEQRVAIGVERPRLAGPGAVADVLVAVAARMQLDRPAPALLHGVEVVPGRVLGVAAVHGPGIDEHHRAPAVAREHRVGIALRIGAGVVEGDQDRMLGQVDRIAGVEAAELLERDAGVSSVVEEGHLLGELGRRDAVVRVGPDAELGALGDPVIQEHRDPPAVDRGGGPDRAVLRGDGGGVRCRRLLAAVAAAGREQRDNRDEQGKLGADADHRSM